MSKIVLIAPPNVSMLEPRIAPPLGLLYLVSWAVRHGDYELSDFQIVDLNIECFQPDAPHGHETHDFSLERCMAEIPKGADLYGIQLASMQMPHGVAIAELLKEREPGALIVAGGSHASALPEEVAGHFDVTITQEGELAFLEVLDSWFANGERTDDIRTNHINRRFDDDLDGLVVHGKKVSPLDSAPMPARELLDFSRYVRKIAGEPATNIITTRGCPARCNFCQQDSLWGAGLRIQSAERILAEVDDIYEKTGIRNLLFLDDSLTARKRSDMLKLCAGLKERGVKWRGWTRANLCARPGEEEVLKAMADSGCQALCIGVEAGTDKVLAAVGKGTNVEMNRVAIKRVREAGMYARASIMVGNPNETWEDVFALIKFVEEVQPDDWILSSYVPLPGTPAWDNPSAFGMVIDKAKARKTNYAHFFVVGGNEQSGIVHSYKDGTTAKEIQLRHDMVQEALLRRAPRQRIRVTIGENKKTATIGG